jgi:hypothetical protein
MSDTKIIQELIDIVVLDGRLKKDLEGFWMQKKERNRIEETRRVLESTRVKLLETLNNGEY